MKSANAKIKRLEILKKKASLKAGLPHLYKFDLYPFQKEIIDSDKEWIYLCAANQLGKTITMLLKIVTVAIDQNIWKRYWIDQPKRFIYLLPNQKLHNENAETKWLEVLPTNEYKDDPYYGWKFMKRGRDYQGIEFNNGLKILFLSYGQSVDCLQNLSAHLICFDEEPDWRLVSEVQTRTKE